MVLEARRVVVANCKGHSIPGFPLRLLSFFFFLLSSFSNISLDQTLDNEKGGFTAG